MKRRMLQMLAVVTVLLVTLGAIKAMQIRAAIAQGASFQPPPEAVTTIVAQEVPWAATQTSIGTVAAVQGVLLSADLPGIVSNIDFDSGRRIQEGQVLVRLDTSQERAQLAAAEAQRDLAELNLKRSRQLLEKQVVAQAEFDAIAAEARQAEARVGEIKATIDRKQIRAPFAGIAGLRQVNLGQYLKGGDPVVQLQSMDPIYVNFSVPQQDVAALRTGAEVRISADSIALSGLSGRITAINSVIDEATRNVQVQATFHNPRGVLRPGMFVNVEVAAGSASQVIALPASAVNYAPYGSSVFIVTDMKAANGKPYRGVRQQFVRLGPGRGDQVAILKGVNPGDEVVTSGVFKLRNGAGIVINNSSQPGNDPAPRPEDS